MVKPQLQPKHAKAAYMLTTVLVCLCSMLLVLELASIGTWVWNLFDYSYPFSLASHWQFALVSQSLTELFNPLTSWLFLVFLSCWLWFPIVKAFKASPLGTKILSKPVQYILPPQTKPLGIKELAGGLLVVSALAVLVAAYPLVSLPIGVLTGTDSTYYYTWLNQLHANGALFAFGTDRPLSNLLLYAVQALTGMSTEWVIKLAPVVCCVVFCLAVFWFVNTATGNNRLALLSAFFTVFSFQTTVSLYVYSLSNWIALILMFFIFGLFLKNAKQGTSVKLTILLASLGVILLLVHPYSWEVVIAIFGSYLIYTLLRRNETKQKIKQLTLFLSANLVFFIVYALLPFGNGLGNAGGAVLNFALPANIFSNVFQVQTGLQNMVDVWVGGLFGDSLLVLLAIVGVFTVANCRRRFSRLMMFWVAVSSAMLLAFSPESFFYYRIVYMVPMQVFAASGLSLVLQKMETANPTKKEKMLMVLKILVFVLVMTFLFNYALSSLAKVPLHILSD